MSVLPDVVFEDLSSRGSADQAEDEWLTRLVRKLRSEDHTLHFAGGARFDDEDLPALYRDAEGTWWAGRFIGELRFEGRTLRIEPRLGLDVIGQWLAYALNLNVVPESATVARRGPLIAQLVDRIWSAAVADAARHGGPRIRRTIRNESSTVRGRLDVHATIRLRAARQARVATIRSERRLENPVSKVLVLADAALRSILGYRPDWRPDRCEETLAQLRQAVGTSPSMPPELELRRVRYSPITRPYESLAEFSVEVARKRGHLVSADDDDVSGVLIDVAELWELFLVHCARRAFGAGQVEHGTSEGEESHLLASIPKSGRTMGRLKPDILIKNSAGQYIAVVDAKYKRLRSWAGSPHGVDRGDLYQLTSYLTGHPEVEVGVLAYPAHPDDHALAAVDGPWLTAIGHKVLFERISPEAELAVQQLARMLGSEPTGESPAAARIATGP